MLQFLLATQHASTKPSNHQEALSLSHVRAYTTYECYRHFTSLGIVSTYYTTDISTYPDQLGPSGKFVENSTKPTCLEITSNQIKYRLLELQIRCGRKVQMQVHTVNSVTG
jgi:hypothetical protein